jgi:hypothetical protein
MVSLIPSVSKKIKEISNFIDLLKNLKRMYFNALWFIRNKNERQGEGTQKSF